MATGISAHDAAILQAEMVKQVALRDAYLAFAGPSASPSPWNPVNQPTYDAAVRLAAVTYLRSCLSSARTHGLLSASLLYEPALRSLGYNY